jgi:mono/diheme cytochrome c family protein
MIKVASKITMAMVGFSLILLTTASLTLAAETRINGLVTSGTGGPLQGVVAIEVGRLYSKQYRYGGSLDAAGNFSVVVPEGGDYAVHIYATGYIYHPIGLSIEDGRTNSFSFTVPPNPAVAEAPVITNLRFETSSDNQDLVVIRLDVNDPNDNLSHQVLAINTVTQSSFIFKPPKFVFPWTKDYPNGVYTLDYNPQGRPFEPREWLFVAADNRCYSSAVLTHPFTPEDGIVAAHAEGSSVAETSPDVQKDFQPTVEIGRQIFADNCAVCHYQDKAETKVGPGLKGLFKWDVTPVEKTPVTEENIRLRIKNGGENMPPYAHIKEPGRTALIMFLKTL